MIQSQRALKKRSRIHENVLDQITKCQILSDKQLLFYYSAASAAVMERPYTYILDIKRGTIKASQPLA